MGDSLTAPVLIGLGVGIAFLVLVVLFLSPQRQFGDAAVKIALRNSTLQEVFEGKEQLVSYYDDRGFASRDYDCPANRCALIVFSERAESENNTARVFVNMNSRKVVAIFASDEHLIAKANELPEVKLFLSKYPGAEIWVNPGKWSSLVAYDVLTPSHRLSLYIFATTSGGFTEVNAVCESHNDSVQTITTNVFEYIETTDCVS